MRLGIIFGGRSGEHEISLMSAVSFISAIDNRKHQIVTIGITKQGKWLLYEGPAENIENGSWEKTAKPFPIGDMREYMDFAFPVLHGPYGEDGTIQGLFEMMDIPYAGSGVLASALAMDKAMSKEIFSKAGIPVCRYKLVLSEDFLQNPEKVCRTIEMEIPLPMFVKPANMGSSVGITKVSKISDLQNALELASQYDRRIIVEEGIDAREIETSIIGNEEIEVGAVGEILPSQDFYDYKAKYFDGGKSKLCIPADLSAKTIEEIKKTATKAYEALDCAGFARADFLVEKKTNKVYLSELNTIPGFTKYSMFSLLFEEVGVSYSRLIERIVEYGYERYNAKNSR